MVTKQTFCFRPIADISQQCDDERAKKGWASSMPHVRVSVIDRKNRDERLVESRMVEIQSERRLNGATAKKILQREFPEMRSTSVMKRGDLWEATEALKPAGDCDYHYIWRIYQVVSA